MNYINGILTAGLAIISSALIGKCKGEMLFTSSSSKAKKLLRNAWVHMRCKFEEAKVCPRGVGVDP